jgi:hypothetical protein
MKILRQFAVQLHILVWCTCSSLWCGYAFVPHAKFSTLFHPTSTIHHDHEAMSVSMSATARDAINWIKTEELEHLVPKEDALNILDELLSDEELIDDSESIVVKNWDKLERKLLEETRSVAEILGKETTDRILKSVENIEGYDPDAVRAFLGSEAVNKLLAQVLYDGIYNFFQTIDVFGNIIGQLPIIGPMRNKIRDEAKRSLDRTVGPLIKTFLQSYTKVAVLEASDFVLSPANRKVFGGANVKLVSSILERSINSLVPPPDMTVKLRNDAFEYLRNAEMTDLEEYVTFCYDIVGDKSVDDVFNVNRVIDASPTLQKTIDRVWTKATTADSE